MSQRWRIEEAFKRLKHRLHLEHTSGLSWLAARQDFGAKAVCDNLAALAAWCAAERHLEPDTAWRINRTLAFNVLRRILPRALVTATLGARIVAEVLAQIALNVRKFVPERHRPRAPRDKPHKFHAYKPAV
ncbi:transposase [Azoarcus sp. CIB]|uniref:transposase n=1 Tax=Aromatoleum sp. (strain CIB) TaxID=198107 RepID=UPI0018DE8A9B|nr:transposase [Azoarcus sp. CIB]